MGIRLNSLNLSHDGSGCYFNLLNATMLMNMISTIFCNASSLIRLSDEQRVLLEQVSSSPSAFESIRRRAKALLMLDEGLPLAEITTLAHMDRRTLYSLIQRHRTGGVRTALLGQRPSLQRRNWLALSPMSR